jgi:hypothetical protein
MAVPLVAGCAVLLREALVKGGTVKPSAALIKALLINGAVPLSEQPAPDSGFGRVNLANSLSVALKEENTAFYEGTAYEDAEDVATDGIVFSRQVHVNLEGKPQNLKATLVWSDFQGERLRNILLLKVKGGDGSERFGYKEAGREEEEESEDDDEDDENINNVQQVLWENIPPGDATITVKYRDLQQPPQPFTILWRLS